MRSLLLKMNTLADVAEPVGGGTHPYYRRYKPTPKDEYLIDSDTTYIDLTNVHLPPYGESNTVAEAVRLFDARAARAVKAAVGWFYIDHMEFIPSDHPSGSHFVPNDPFGDLLELKPHGGDTTP